MAIDSLFKGIRDPNASVLTASATLTSKGDQHYDVDTSAGAVALALPPAAENPGVHISVRKIGGGSNALTVTGVTGGGIGASTALVSMEDDSDNALFRSNGCFWQTLSSYVAD